MVAHIPIKPGVVFWAHPTDDCPKPHPWIVVSECVQGSVLIVNITDAENYPESPCHLAVGDHEVITKPSVIKYPEAIEASAKGMSVALGRAVTVRHYPDLRPDLLVKVIAGIKACGDMDPRLKRKYGFEKRVVH